jgi:ubiquinone/menaquinone biosynthesis C-methylase UbiE
MANGHVERFNTAAEAYETDRYPGRAQCMRTVLAFLESQAEGVILDVGCGPGRQLVALSPLIRSGYGLDPAEQMIRRAAQSATDLVNLHFCVGSAQALPPGVCHVGVSKIFSN